VRLPGAERSVVDPAKVRDYLLSSAHPVGRFKARFFLGLGYSPENWQALVLDLRRHAEGGRVTMGERSSYGQKFEVRGRLIGPSGRGAEVIAIWIVLAGGGAPRLVTAFPG
jgi:hypothetical protein